MKQIVRSLFTLGLVASVIARADCALDDFAKPYLNANLWNYRNSLSSDQMAQHNDALREALRGACTTKFSTSFPDAPVDKRFRRDAATFAEAKDELSRISQHPIASLSATAARDSDHSIGFCFGRAYYMHIDSLRHLRMTADMVRKLWVVGKHDKWGHHVTTIVKAREGGWWVLDPITGVVSVEKWMQSWASFGNSSKEAGFFITPAERFSPFSGAKYSSADLKDNAGYYKSYFTDLQAFERKTLESAGAFQPGGGSVQPPVIGPTPHRQDEVVRAVLVFIPFQDFGLSLADAKHNPGDARRTIAAKLIGALSAQGISAKIQLGFINHINWNVPERPEMTKTKIQLPKGATTSQIQEALAAAGVQNVAITPDG